MRLNSSHVWLVVSHSSVVMLPRTARAFSRAARRHDTMLDGCVSSRTMNPMTRLGSIDPWRVSYALVSSLMPSMPRQPCSAFSADCGSSDVW